MSGSVDGCVLDDGTRLPLPGIYLLDSGGVLDGYVGLEATDARRRLLSALGSD